MDKKNEAIIVTLVLSVIMFTFVGLMFGGMTGYSVGGAVDSENEDSINIGSNSPPNNEDPSEPEFELVDNPTTTTPTYNDDPEKKIRDCIESCEINCIESNGANNFGFNNILYDFNQYNWQDVPHYNYGSSVLFNIESEIDNYEDLDYILYYTSDLKQKYNKINVNFGDIVEVDGQFYINDLVKGYYRIDATYRDKLIAQEKFIVDKDEALFSFMLKSIKNLI